MIFAMASEWQFYVYLYRDPLTDEPVYVGKGKGARAESHLWAKARTNDRLKKFIDARSAQGLAVEPEIIAQCDEENAFLIEQSLIHYFGRADLGKGPLFNYTSGGDGVSNPSERVRRLQADAQYKRWGGLKEYDFVNAFTGEHFTGTFSDLVKHTSISQRAIYRLKNDDTVHSVAGWTFKGNETKVNRYAHSFDFVNALTGQKFHGTISELSKRFEDAHLSLVSQMVNGKVRHAHGWVLQENKDKLRPLVKTPFGQVREIQFPWENAKATVDSKNAWVLVREMFHFWTEEFNCDPKIGAARVLKAMGYENMKAQHNYERAFKRVRDGEIDVINNPYYDQFIENFAGS